MASFSSDSVAGHHLLRHLQRVDVELGIGDVDLEEGERVRELFGRVGHLRHAGGGGDQGVERGIGVRGPHHVEAGVAGARRVGGNLEHQPALRAEALHQRGGGDAGFFRDFRQRQLHRAKPRHDADGGVDQVLVGDGSGTAGHVT